jgi:putative oxidoreductase
MLNNIGLLILRVCFGAFMLLAHGWPKLMSYSDRAANFPDPLGVGASASMMLTVLAEVVCAGLVMLGFYTRYAALPLVFAMGVAAFLVHAGDPFAKMELALLYAAGFLAIALVGPGRFSFDGARGRV